MPTSSIEHPASSIEHPASSIQHRASSIKHPASSIQYQASSIQLNTLSPDNGGGSGPDYCPAERGFGGRLPGPFDIGAGIGLAAKDPTL
jgi:hypothetical protein